MFGTETKGFAIITAVVAISTYAVVFGLLHPLRRKDAKVWIQEIVGSVRGAINGNKKEDEKLTRTTGSRASEEGEEERNAVDGEMEDILEDAAAQTSTEVKPLRARIMSRLRGGRKEWEGDHEIGNVEAPAGL